MANMSKERSAMLFMNENIHADVWHMSKVEEYLQIRKYFTNYEELRIMKLHDVNPYKITMYHQLITGVGSDGVNVFRSDCGSPAVCVNRDNAKIYDTRGVANQRQISRDMNELRNLGYRNVSIVSPNYLRRKYKVYCYGSQLPQVWATQDCQGHTADQRQAGEFYVTKEAEDYLHTAFKHISHEIGFI
jgi:hypothetical protein